LLHVAFDELVLFPLGEPLVEPEEPEIAAAEVATGAAENPVPLVTVARVEIVRAETPLPAAALDAAAVEEPEPDPPYEAAVVASAEEDPAAEDADPVAADPKVPTPAPSLVTEAQPEPVVLLPRAVLKGVTALEPGEG
jgi:hypothetical protein